MMENKPDKKWVELIGGLLITVGALVISYYLFKCAWGAGAAIWVIVAIIWDAFCYAIAKDLDENLHRAYKWLPGGGVVGLVVALRRNTKEEGEE